MASNQVSKSKIAVYAYLVTDAFASSLKSSLDSDAYLLKIFLTHSDFVEAIEVCQDGVDCLILDAQKDLSSLLAELRSRSVFLPTILIEDKLSESVVGESEADHSLDYHTAVHRLGFRQLDQLPSNIDKVISRFLEISSEDKNAYSAQLDIDEQERVLLVSQQSRLAEKLKERLGYLGIYYKRDPDRFLRHLSPDEKKQTLAQLKQSYREIILNYFTDDPLLNQKIDNYVNSAFFADVPVVQIVEIHMELMDAFSKQLKLEGRSEEILLDYRLTLIDTISNLCEMYRRSIPRST